MIRTIIALLLYSLTFQNSECKAQSYIIDTEFNSGISTFGDFSNLILVENNKILVNGALGGYEEQYNLVRLNYNGLKDQSFPMLTQYSVVPGAVFSHNSKYLYSYFRSCDSLGCEYSTCFDMDGTPCTESEWLMPYIHDPYGYSSLIIPSGLSLQDTAVLMCGAFRTDLNNPNRWQCLVRTDADGNHDATFPLFEAEPNLPSYVKLLEIPNGGYFLTGRWQSMNGHHSPGIIKLTSNFEIDTTFQSPFESVSVVNSHIDSSGRPWISAWYANFDTVQDSTINLMRLQTDGAIDSTFNIPTIDYFNNEYISGGNFILAFLDVGDGYIIGGTFSKINGLDNSCIAKLNNEGEVIPSFFDTSVIEYATRFEYPINDDTNISAPQITQLTQLPDGKILVGGSFNFEIGGSHVHNVMRLKEWSVGNEKIKAVENKLKLYPNPAQSQVNFNLSNNFEINDFYLVLSDPQGRVIDYIYKNKISSKNNIIDVSNLHSGIYIVSLIHKNHVIAREKLIVNK